MGEVIKVLDWLLENLVQICTVMLELFGIIVLVSTAVSCFVQWIRNKRQLIRLNLAQGIALALEFKMGGEVHDRGGEKWSRNGWNLRSGVCEDHGDQDAWNIVRCRNRQQRG